MLHILQHCLSHQESKSSVDILQGAFLKLLVLNIGQVDGHPADLPPLSMYPKSPSTENILRKLLLLVYDVVTTSGTKGSRLEIIHKQSDVISRLQTIDAELLQWEDSLPEAWKYTTLSEPEGDGYESDETSTSILFPLPNAMFLWGIFWMTRLDLLQRQYRLLSTAIEMSEIWSGMQRLVEIVSTAVPQMAGLTVGTSGRGKIIESLYATRLLFMASRVPHLPDNTVLRISQLLDLIAQQKGVGQALVWRQEILQPHF
jgi:hypothetical protein